MKRVGGEAEAEESSIHRIKGRGFASQHTCFAGASPSPIPIPIPIPSYPINLSKAPECAFALGSG